MQSNNVLGVDIGGTKVSCGVVCGNEIEKKHTVNILANKPKEEILNDIILAIEQVFLPNIVGIGVGVPGFVDSENGIAYQLNNIPSWKEVHLKAAIEKHFNKPVYVNNDANCFAVGEKYFGKGKNFKHFVGLTIGTGLGTGIILNNHLYSGVNCGAGEFGCIPYLGGIVENFCSGQFFEQQHIISGSELNKLAKQHNTEAMAIFSEYGIHLGNAIKTILFALAPQAIIIGGSVSQSFEYYQHAMWQSVKQFPFNAVLKDLVIEPSDISDAAILGAAALYFDAQK